MIQHATANENEVPQLVDAEGPIPRFPRRTVDPATGAVPPLSEEERAARASALARVLDLVASIPDETDGDRAYAEGMRDIDAMRPHRKLFETMY